MRACSVVSCQSIPTAVAFRWRSHCSTLYRSALIGEAARKALVTQDARLDLGDVQPSAFGRSDRAAGWAERPSRRAVLGHGAQLDPLGQPPCFLGREGLVQAGEPVGVELVRDEHDPSTAPLSSASR
jgi:hypothetical protein